MFARARALQSGYSRPLVTSSQSVSTRLVWRVMMQRSFAAFPQWKEPVIECRGDYREESHLEEHVGGPLYQHQMSLPRLPVPTLEETMKRFLPTALPLARSPQEKASLEKACASFPREAAVLQQRLEDRRDNEMKDSSWLQHWWNTLGYLQIRDPIVINVSYFFHFSDDSTLPDSSSSSAKSLGVLRGSAILTAVAEFRQQVCSGTLPAEVIGKKKTTLCSTAYKYMFNGCRIPRLEEDTYRIYDPSLHSHCIVARKGHFFAVEFCDKETGEPLPLDILEASLQECIDQADAADPPLALGYFTGDNRDVGAKGRQALIDAGGSEMEQQLAKLESGAILLCLDDEEPVSRQQCGELFWHGGLKSGANRWFDKSIQIICTNNGKTGFLGEHSLMDGMAMIKLAHHITNTTYASVRERSTTTEPKASGVENLFQNVTPTLQSSSVPELVNQSKANFEELIGAHDLHVQSFQGYGSSFIKKAGFSPDAYVQMAMQLATYRLFGGEQAGTYEATQVRPFLHGRTETTRTVSTESQAFVQRMGMVPFQELANSEACAEKVSLLREAAGAHVKFISSAAQGMGVDRHFFGLAMMVQDGEETPALLSDPLFTYSKRWRVSTSHLTHPNFENWGYGEVVPDGVGLAYGVKADCCIFNVTALKEHNWTDRLCHYLEEALLEMRAILDVEEMKSKL